jgi:hypothetical protein
MPRISVADPLLELEAFALILDVLGFILPPELAAACPMPPNELLDDPELEAMTQGQRSRLVR